MMAGKARFRMVLVTQRIEAMNQRPECGGRGCPECGLAQSAVHKDPHEEHDLARWDAESPQAHTMSA